MSILHIRVRSIYILHSSRNSTRRHSLYGGKQFVLKDGTETISLSLKSALLEHHVTEVNEERLSGSSSLSWVWNASRNATLKGVVGSKMLNGRKRLCTS